MTRSYGGGPDRPPRDKQPELREDMSDLDSRLDRLSRYRSDEEIKVQAVRVDFGKRLVAMIIDIAAAFILSSAINFIPFAAKFVTANLLLVILLTVRDYFFEGRGIGKNLMGLQVVDVKTGLPCSLGQALKRNLVLYGPVMVLFVAALIVGIINTFVSLPPWLHSGVFEIINTAGMLYIFAVIPYEAYRVYSRPDGRRFGDQFAGTAIVEAPMDFSTPVPRQ